MGITPDLQAALLELRTALDFLDRCRVDEEAKYNGALRDAHEWVESAARGAVDAHKVICPKCGKVFANGRGGCEGAQHGNFGCAMNNPYRLSVNESEERK